MPIRTPAVARAVTAFAVVASMAITVLAWPGTIAAQAWPAKPIRLVIPFPPGGSTDTTGRLLAQSFAESLGQSVVVENKPGGNLVIGVDAVAKAPPDGYTLLFTLDIAVTMNQHLLSKLPYSPEKDFAPVSLVTTQQMWFVAGPKLGARTPQELVALAKAQPRKINYGSGAVVGQLTGELFRMLTGAEMTYVPFKGSAPALQALLAGDIDLAVADITPFAPYIAQGRLRALGQTGTQRFESLPDVPTMIEQGIRDFEVTGWFGLFAPAGTPEPVISRLNGETAKILARPDVRQKILSFGVMPTASTPQALAARAREDAEKWGKVIRAAGVRLD